MGLLYIRVCVLFHASCFSMAGSDISCIIFVVYLVLYINFHKIIIQLIIIW